MTDEGSNLTPARPIAPRRRLTVGTQMAQPMREPRPDAADPLPAETALPAALTAEPVGAEYLPVAKDESQAIVAEPAEEPAVAQTATAGEVTPPAPEPEPAPESEPEAAPAAVPEPTPAREAALAPKANATPLASIPAPEPAPPPRSTPPPAEPVKPSPPPPPPAPAAPPPAPSAAQPAPTAEPQAAAQPASAAQPQAAAQPAPAADPQAAPAAEPEFDFPRTMRETINRVDGSWASFRAIALRFPSERMDERLSEDGWTVKQMLEHIAAWHDLTAERLIKRINSGSPVELGRDTDKFNASVARQAIGKTSGEVLKDMDATFNRLRRQMARLSDDDLAADDWWAAWVIGGNTYGHYEEHWAEIYTPDLPPGSRNRR